MPKGLVCIKYWDKLNNLRNHLNNLVIQRTLTHTNMFHLITKCKILHCNIEPTRLDQFTLIKKLVLHCYIPIEDLAKLEPMEVEPFKLLRIRVTIS